MNSKKILKVGALLAIIVLASSCNRGGTGCPFEIEAGFSLLDLFLR